MAQPAAVLSVLVTANTKQATTGLMRLNTRLASTDKQTQTAMSSMKQFGKTAGLVAGAAGVGALAAGAKKAFGEFREAQKVTEQTNAVLKSTGDVAKVTAKEIENLAEQISLKSGIDDEAIQKGENLLLTFTKIRNETGKGNDIFSRATQVITDMSVALDQDLKTSAIQVGKALQDPEKGIANLRRVGVNFNQTQSDMIKKWVDHGDQMKAQKFILQELTREFGGSAAAQADNVDKLKVAWDNLFERIGKAFGPAVEEAMGDLARFIRQMETGKGKGGEFNERLKEIGQAFRDIKPALEVWIDAVKLAIKFNIELGKRVVTATKWAIEAVKATGGVFRDVWGNIKRFVGNTMAEIFRGFAKLFDLASHLPGVGDKFGKLRDKANAFADRVDKAGEQTKKLGYEIKKLPANKRINIKVDASVGAIKYGGFNPLTGQPMGGPPAGGPGSILDQIGGKVAGKVDGKKLLAQAGQPGSAPGKLGMLEELGHRAGLYTSSGYRPGDPGFHGQNRARDMAGSPANMLAYARMLYNTYGTSINELIHTPLGVGIDAHRAGRLTSLYPAATLADHYDHVHVAMAKGGRANQKVRALVGEEGPEIVDLPVGAFVHTASKSKAMMRGRIAAFASGGTVARAAQAAGFRGNDLVRAVAEAKGESGWNERAVGDGGWSKGLMQIYTKVHTWARNLNLFDPLTNMKAAKKIWDWQGWGAWHADHVPHIAAAKAAVDAIRSKAKTPPPKPKPKPPPGKKGTLNRKPYGGIGRGGILDAFINFQADRLNRLDALAALTPDMADDIAVAADAVKTWETWLNVAQINNIPAGITATAQNLKSARDRYTELTTPDTSAADEAAAAAAAYTAELAATRAGLLEQLLREANQRTAVSQAQYGALRYGGQFADGGIVPGPIGRPSLIVAHGGETVTPPGANNVQVIVNGDISNVPRGKQPIEIRDIRGSGRAPLPGGGGGWN